MEIVFLEWNSYGNRDMIDAFERIGIRVVRRKIESGVRTNRQETEAALRPALEKHEPQFVFSFNYIPDVSQVCQENDVPYVSWVYDSPYINVYSYTVLNPCNHIFLFDYALYDRLAGEGISTVYYLPLGASRHRYQCLQNTELCRKKYGADISFVGSLYDEPKHRLFDKFQGISDYAKGYLDAITRAQRHVYGYNFLEELLLPEILQEMERVYPTNPNAMTAMKPKEIYADYVLNRHVTAMERRELLEKLGKVFSGHDIRLYTNNDSVRIGGVKNMGSADYDKEMPYVFLNSKINLNISLRSIKTGIPLRAFDIMGCGGFLLSNYQQELTEYFVPGEDFVYYENQEDMIEKAEYYLSHDKERCEIAENGREKVFREHTMEMRAQEMVRQILSSDNA